MIPKKLVLGLDPRMDTGSWIMLKPKARYAFSAGYAAPPAGGLSFPTNGEDTIPLRKGLAAWPEPLNSNTRDDRPAGSRRRPHGHRDDESPCPGRAFEQGA